MQSRLLSNAAPVDDRLRRVLEAGRRIDDDRRIARPGDDRPPLARQRRPGHGRAAGHDQEPHASVLEQGRRPIRAWAGR